MIDLSYCLLEGSKQSLQIVRMSINLRRPASQMIFSTMILHPSQHPKTNRSCNKQPTRGPGSLESTMNTLYEAEAKVTATDKTIAFNQLKPSRQNLPLRLKSNPPQNPRSSNPPSPPLEGTACPLAVSKSLNSQKTNSAPASNQRS